MKEVSLDEIAAIDAEPQEKKTRTKKPKHDLDSRTVPGIGVTIWFKARHTGATVDPESSGCSYCGEHRVTTPVEELLGEDYVDKFMCRICFLAGIPF